VAGRISLHLGDITQDARADAIVNAANLGTLDAHPEVQEVRFWLYDQATLDVFSRRLEELSDRSISGAEPPTR
jgi:O-acetyl-ADP-ribose deacetylase (regulator of RNase III)